MRVGKTHLRQAKEDKERKQDDSDLQLKSEIRLKCKC